MHDKFLTALKSHTKKTLSVIIALLCVTCGVTPQVTITTKYVNENTQEISITFALPKKDFLYKDYIQFSVADPHVTLSNWHTNNIPLLHYDPSFKSTKHIFIDNITINITAKAMEQYNEKTYLYFTYYQKSEKKMKQIEHPLSFIHNTPTETIKDDNTIKKTIPDYQKKLTHPQAKKLDTYLHLVSHYTSLVHIYIQKIDILSYLLITFFVFTGGIICIKKSTKISWNYLRTFCTLLGIILIASTVLLLFKIMQLLLPI